MEQRHGVLGLETAKSVFVTFLILAVTAVAIILSLTALNDSVGDTIDNVKTSHSAINETTGGINQTGYQVVNANSSVGSYVLTDAWFNNTSPTQIPLANLTISSTGLVQNATIITYDSSANVSYTYVLTTDTKKTDNIVGNVSGGLETFFASTGTIFSILIVVVIILAISIIIWAVGRFGMRTEDSVNL